MLRAHEEFQAAVGEVFRQRSDRPTAHGLVPSWHATRLTIARSTTYANYVNAVLAPTIPFAAWTALNSGYMKLGGAGGLAPKRRWTADVDSARPRNHQSWPRAAGDDAVAVDDGAKTGKAIDGDG